jgi:hypothetical protein
MRSAAAANANATAAAAAPVVATAAAAVAADTCRSKAFFHCVDFDALPQLQPSFEGRRWAGQDQSLVRVSLYV